MRNRNTTHNSTYPNVAVQWLNQALCKVHHSNFASTFELKTIALTNLRSVSGNQSEQGMKNLIKKNANYLLI